ncbi:MAG: VOC family protein, partial [Candidatus Dormibacteria bacterium]
EWVGLNPVQPRLTAGTVKAAHETAEARRESPGFLRGEEVKVHHVQLAIPSGGEARCRAFWRDLLGMGELEKLPALAPRGGCWFRVGSLEIHLGVEDPFVPARKAHPGLLVEGLHGLAERPVTAGYPVTWDSGFPGHGRFYTEDRFGNRLEFLQAEPA